MSREVWEAQPWCKAQGGPFWAPIGIRRMGGGVGGPRKSKSSENNLTPGGFLLRVRMPAGMRLRDNSRPARSIGDTGGHGACQAAAGSQVRAPACGSGRRPVLKEGSAGSKGRVWSCTISREPEDRHLRTGRRWGSGPRGGGGGGKWQQAEKNMRVGEATTALELGVTWWLPGVPQVTVHAKPAHRTSPAMYLCDTYLCHM